MSDSNIPRGEPAEPAARRVLPAWLVPVLGLAASLGVFLLVRQWDTARVAREFEWRARSAAGDLREEVVRSEDALYTLRDLYDSSETVTAEEFKRTADDLRARHPGIHTLAFVEATAGGARTIGQIEPLEENQGALGYDHAGGPYAAVLAEAAASGQPRGTIRSALHAPGPAQFGWDVFLPLYTPGAPMPTAAERSARLRGFIEGTFRLADLVGSMTRENPARTVEVLLLDETPGTPAPFLIAQVGDEIRTAPPPVAEEFLTGLHLAVPLAVSGRSWRLLFRPAPDWLAAQSTSYAAAFLVTGVLLTGLLASILRSAQRRSATVEKLVARRTAELRAAQEKLREDLRQRAAAEAALRASEERYRAFVEQSTEGIWRFENEPPIPVHLPVEEQIALLYQRARLAECNDAMARMYGHASAAEMTGRRMHEITPQDDPMNLAYHRAFIACGYRLADWETRDVDKDGNVKYFLNNETGIVEDGLFKRAWGTQRDITARRRAEEEHHEQETRLRLAIGAARLGTWESDQRTHVVTWSPETEAMFGLEPGAFDGRLETYFSFIHPDDRGRIRANIRRAIEDPAADSTTDHQLRIVRGDGSLRWLVARGVVLRDAAGQPLRMIGAILDVTAQRQAEEERTLIERKLQETQKLESLGVLAGGIAHDFNNLLTGVLGHASLARSELPPDSPAQESLAQIETGAQRAAELCKQMLAYSGKGRFVVRRLDLSAVVRDTAELLQLSIGKNAVLRYALAKDLPAVTADATQLRQIVMNLVINASEAIGETSGLITIATGRMRADRAYLAATYLSPGLPEGEYAFLEVSDNGSGMDAATQAKIFDPFFTTKFTGRGLGLAAVLGIVRGHRGALKVYSEPGRGTTFKLLLPRAEGPADEPPATVEKAAAAWRGSGLVLVIDDEEVVRTIAARMLRNMGFEPLLAVNGREGADVFASRAGEIAAVLLDLTMPVLDGAATLSELRRIRPDVRVLLMSGFTEDDAVARFAGKGLAGFLQKPFKTDELRTALRAMLEAGLKPET